VSTRFADRKVRPAHQTSLVQSDPAVPQIRVLQPYGIEIFPVGIANGLGVELVDPIGKQRPDLRSLRSSLGRRSTSLSTCKTRRCRRSRRATVQVCPSTSTLPRRPVLTSLKSSRILLKVSPRQSPSSAILLPIRQMPTGPRSDPTFSCSPPKTSTLPDFEASLSLRSGS
jgi:hypothetical protein